MRCVGALKLWCFLLNFHHFPLERAIHFILLLLRSSGQALLTHRLRQVLFGDFSIGADTRHNVRSDRTWNKGTSRKVRIDWLSQAGTRVYILKVGKWIVCESQESFNDFGDNFCCFQTQKMNCEQQPKQMGGGTQTHTHTHKHILLQQVRDD